MGVIERDPAGLLGRIPELSKLADESPAVRRAIERGKPGALYRALLFVRWFGKSAERKSGAAELIARRRLFIEPITSPPALITYNGIGVRLYGNAELDADRTYIATQYAVFIFVPVFPLRSYLVADGERSGSWRFIGKVPPTVFHYLWQRATALVLVLCVAAAALRSVDSYLHGTLYVASDLSKAVDVRVEGARPFFVMPHGVTPVRLRAGKHRIDVSIGGKLIDSGTAEVRRGHAVTWWNVVGSALIYRDEVAYYAKGGSEPAYHEAEIFCEPGQGTCEDADYVFTTPPQSISMSKDQTTVVRHRVDMMKSDATCLAYLSLHDRTKEAAALAARLSEIDGYSGTILQTATALLERSGDPDGAVRLARKALEADDTAIERHRVYQGIMESLGKQEILVAEYRKRLASRPESPDNLYLLARIVGGKEEEPLLDSGLAASPRHPYLLRARAFRDLRLGRFERVDQNLTTLRTVDHAMWLESMELQLQALTALGRIAAARSLIDEVVGDRSMPNPKRLELVVDGVLLSRFEPLADPESLIGKLVMSNGEPAVADRLIARLNGCLPVEQNDFQQILDEPLRAALKATFVARTTPAAALDVLAKLGEGVVSRLSLVDWALLLGEAARMEPAHVALPLLEKTSRVGRKVEEDFVRYVREGQTTDDLENLPGDLRAAARLARARRTGVGEGERKRLYASVATDDVFRGPVSRAKETWTN
jgi:hypothetical protein